MKNPKPLSLDHFRFVFDIHVQLFYIMRIFLIKDTPTCAAHRYLTHKTIAVAKVRANSVRVYKKSKGNLRFLKQNYLDSDTPFFIKFCSLHKFSSVPNS